MPASPRPLRRSARSRPRRVVPDTAEPLPLVEFVLDGVESDDWVTETLTSQGAAFRLLACRPADRGRRRLLRLFEVQTGPDGLEPLLRRLRSRLSERDLSVAEMAKSRALLRVSVPMPAGCGAAFDQGDLCIGCRFLGKAFGTRLSTWRVLVPRLVDARRLLSAAEPKGGPRPTLVRAGAYRRRWGLTGRQERALELAFRLGYFDYPRKISLATLAGHLGVGRSTALELLRKATTKLAADRFLAGPSIGPSP